jgi:hypothetical protein
MEIVFDGMNTYFIWPSGLDVPDWAWQIAADDNKAIVCYGAFENALLISN